MTIGIDASRANKKHKTGTEWYAYYLIREFAKIDSENEYVLYTNKPLLGGLMDLGESGEVLDLSRKIEYDSEGYQILKSPHNNFKAKVLKWPFEYFWTLGGLSLEMIYNRPDVLFVPSHVLPLFRPKKTVVTIHDIGFIKDSSLFDKEEIGPNDSWLRRIINIATKILTLGKYEANSYDYLRWSTRYALKKATKIITVSHFSKMEISGSYNLNNGKIEVISNGYNDKLYKKIDDKDKVASVLSEFGIDFPYFFYIGRLEKKKNIVNLVEAYAILKDKYRDIEHKLVLVGDASYGYDEIKYMTREFDIVDDVIMPGWVEEELLPYFYAGSSAFVFPSKYEGFGIPLLQSMACQTPIAASRVSSIPEVAGEAAIYFHPDFALSIADAMYRLIKDDQHVKTIISKGSQRVKSYSWAKCAKETHSLISNL